MWVILTGQSLRDLKIHFVSRELEFFVFTRFQRERWRIEEIQWVIHGLEVKYILKHIPKGL